MSRAEAIIQEFLTLSSEEQETVLRELERRRERVRRATEALERFKGKGKGIWNLDAQEYVNQLRDDDR